MRICNDVNELWKQAAMNNIPIVVRNLDIIEVPEQYQDKVRILTYDDLDDDNYNIGDCILYDGTALLIWMLDRFYGLTPMIGRI